MKVKANYYKIHHKPRMNCHGHTGARQWWYQHSTPTVEAVHLRTGVWWRTPLMAIFSPPFSAWKFMLGRNLLADAKLTCSWWASVPLQFEALEIVELVEGEWDVLLSGHRFLPKAILLTPPVGVWSEGRAFSCCSWSSFLLRKRPPGPRTRFIAWRCRDSWRYGWEGKKTFILIDITHKKCPNCVCNRWINSAVQR